MAPKHFPTPTIDWKKPPYAVILPWSKRSTRKNGFHIPQQANLATKTCIMSSVRLWKRATHLSSPFYFLKMYHSGNIILRLLLTRGWNLYCEFSTVLRFCGRIHSIRRRPSLGLTFIEGPLNNSSHSSQDCANRFMLAKRRPIFLEHGWEINRPLAPDRTSLIVYGLS